MDRSQWLTDMIETVIGVLAAIKENDGLPEESRQRCDHYYNGLHDLFHDLSLWLRELLEWAPLTPETRALATHAANVLNEAGIPFTLTDSVAVWRHHDDGDARPRWPHPNGAT